MITSHDIRFWLKNQLQDLGVFQLSDYFQKYRTLYKPHCMSFVYEFLNCNTHDFYCNFKESVDTRINRYFNLCKSEKINENKLKAGDFVVYKESGKWGHIALSIGKFNNTPYVISKYGYEFNAFIHPINHVGDHFGIAHFFSNNIKLTEKALDKMNLVLKELELFLEENKNVQILPLSVNKEFLQITIKKLI